MGALTARVAGELLARLNLPKYQGLQLLLGFCELLLQRFDMGKAVQRGIQLTQAVLHRGGLSGACDDGVLDVLLLFFAKQSDCSQAFPAKGCFFPLFAGSFMHGDGNARIDGGAGNLFKDRRPLIGIGLKKSGKFALRQQDGTGEAVVIHARELLNQPDHLLAARFQHGIVTRIDQFMFGRLQFAVGTPAGPVLRPMAPVGPVTGFKINFGKTVASPARHNFIAAFADMAQSGGAGKKGETKGVQDG